jgi:hypothetical protein
VRVYSELTGDDAEMTEIQDQFDCLMGDAAARKDVFEAALLLAEAASPSPVKRAKQPDQCLDAYVDFLKRNKIGGLEVVSMIEAAKEALASLKAGRHKALSEQGHKDAAKRPHLPFIEMATAQPACAEFRTVCIKLMVELADQPEKLERRLLALERVALYFLLLSQADKPVKRHARAQSMLASMHDEAEVPNAYKLSAEERASCAEGLNVPFDGTKRVSAAKAILGKLNAHELWKGSETASVEAQVNLEHVMPQKPAKTSWTEDWPDPEKAGESLHMLGNLAIVNVKMNSKMGNGGFADKKEEFRKSPFPLTREIAGYHCWKEADLKKAHRRVLALANSVFDVG